MGLNLFQFCKVKILNYKNVIIWDLTGYILKIEGLVWSLIEYEDESLNDNVIIKLE